MALTKLRSKNNNYNSQFNHLIKCIINSRIILDEDMNCISKTYCEEEDNYCNTKFSFLEKVCGGISLTAAIFVIQRRLPIFCIPISATPVLFVGIQRLREIFYRRGQNHNVEILLKSICATLKLNRMICEYVDFRNTNNPVTDGVMNPYTKTIRQLMDIIFKEEVHFLQSFIKFVRQFGTYIPELKSDYAYLENIEFEEFNTRNVNSINDCVTYLKKLCDMYLLVASNCLTCLTLTLCPEMWAVNDINVDEVLDKIVPKMKKIAENCYNKINLKFDDVKYYYLNRKPIKPKIESPASSTTSSKLHLGTCNMMMHTSEILEKSQIVFNILQKQRLQTLYENENMAKYIAELRSQVFGYYESLDILHKLYEVKIKQMKPPMYFKNETSSEPSVNSSISVDERFLDTSFNPSEPSDDEEFETYTGANDPLSAGTSISYYEEQESRRLASLFSQELKLKLKGHSQFMAARNKRGIIDEQPDRVRRIPVPTKADLEQLKLDFNPRNLIPDLPGPIPVPRPLPNCDDFNSRNLVPPPPPPPLPPIDLGPYGDMAGTPYTVNSVDDFLDSIKTASKNRKRDEEIFQ